MLTPASYARLWIFWILLTAAALVACMFFGPGLHRVNFGWPSDPNIRDFRELRILSAAAVGFGLAASGVTLQALLRNPLADPYVLGISSGSSVGVMLWLLCTGPFAAAVMHSHSDLLIWILNQGQVVPALIGAILTCIVVFVLAKSRWGGTADPVTLLLVGVVIAAINGAILMLIQSLDPSGVNKNFINYIMGAISTSTTWQLFTLAVIVLAAGYLPVLLASRSLNIATLSEMEAASLGIRISTLRNLCFIAASVMTAAAIMLSGPIGFVGLICPHICRSLVGADHRKLIVAAPFAGAVFLMLADTFVNATGTFIGSELPVGVITAICGGPFFLLLLKHRPGATGGGAT
jgi:iron complex transport system permease protein